MMRPEHLESLQQLLLFDEVVVAAVVVVVVGVEDAEKNFEVTKIENLLGVKIMSFWFHFLFAFSHTSSRTPLS